MPRTVFRTGNRQVRCSCQYPECQRYRCRSIAIIVARIYRKSDGTFTGNVTLVEGANTVTFVATSASGVDTTITRTLNLDTKAPVITNVTITPNPVDGGKTYVVAVEVTD